MCTSLMSLFGSIIDQSYVLCRFLNSVILSTKLDSTCTFEIGKIAHAKGMIPSVEDARGEGEYERG